MITVAWVKQTVRLAFRGLTALGLLLVLVTATPVVRWWAGALAGSWDRPEGEVLIVLGGSSLEDGIIGENSYWRSVHAIRAYREGVFREVVVTGGGPYQTSIAAPMRDLMACSGVPLQAIRIETASNSTRENAMFTRKLLAESPGRKVLLTSDYQMFRARRAFRKVGLEVLPRPFRDGVALSDCWSCRWFIFLQLARESTKIVYYYARGWI